MISEFISMTAFKCTTATLGLAVLFSLSGCGGSDLELLPVTGTVTYLGLPVSGATVVFQPENGPPSTATTDEEGNFTMNTRGESGVAVGKSVVVITALEPMDIEVAEGSGDEDIAADDPAAAEAAMTDEVMEAMANRKSRIPEKYGHPRTSGLQVEVSADGKSHFDFDLT
jgi:hypothetical protein